MREVVGSQKKVVESQKKCEVMFKSSGKREREIEAGTKLNIKKYDITQHMTYVYLIFLSFETSPHSLPSLNVCMHLCVPSVLLGL